MAVVVFFLALFAAMTLATEAYAQGAEIPIYQAPSEDDPLYATDLDHFREPVWVTEVPDSVLSGLEKYGFLEVKLGSVLTTTWDITVTLPVTAWIPVEATYEVVTPEDLRLKAIETISETIASTVETLDARTYASFTMGEIRLLNETGMYSIPGYAVEVLKEWGEVLQFDFLALIPKWNAAGSSADPASTPATTGNPPVDPAKAPAKATPVPAPTPSPPPAAKASAIVALKYDETGGVKLVVGQSKLVAEYLRLESPISQSALESAVAQIQLEADKAKVTRHEGSTLTLAQDQAWLVWCSNATAVDPPADVSLVHELTLLAGDTFGRIWIQVPFAEDVPLRSDDTWSGCSAQFWAVAVH